MYLQISRKCCCSRASAEFSVVCLITVSWLWSEAKRFTWKWFSTGYCWAPSNWTFDHWNPCSYSSKFIALTPKSNSTTCQNIYKLGWGNLWSIYYYSAKLDFLFSTLGSQTAPVLDDADCTSAQTCKSQRKYINISHEAYSLITLTKFISVGPLSWS